MCFPAIVTQLKRIIEHRNGDCGDMCTMYVHLSYIYPMLRCHISPSWPSALCHCDFFDLGLRLEFYGAFDVAPFYSPDIDSQFSRLMPSEVQDALMPSGSANQLCIKNASSFPDVLEFERKTVQHMTCFFDRCSSQTATLPTLAQKPPIFRSLSDKISWEIASDKNQIKKCKSAGSEDSAEQQKFTWNPQLTTCLSHNPFWKDTSSNKTPEFKMAKQHLGLILEALVLGHFYPWPWSHLSVAPCFFQLSFQFPSSMVHAG